MSKNTPGPWKLSHGGLPGDDGFSIVTNNAEADLVKVICECWPCTIVSNEHRDELAANGRLIALAPQLAESLRELRDFGDYTVFGRHAELVKQVVAKADRLLEQIDY